jgi:hypothetical protein
MKPYERSELGGVGEGLCPLDSAQPLTQLQLGNRVPSFRNPLPMAEGISRSKNRGQSLKGQSPRLRSTGTVPLGTVPNLPATKAC